MTVSQMRRYIEDAYPGSKWKLRVAAMSDAQVIATYRRLTKKD